MLLSAETRRGTGITSQSGPIPANQTFHPWIPGRTAVTWDGARIHHADTPGCNTELVRSSQASAQLEAIPRSFLREAAIGVAGIIPEDLDAGNLTIPLGVSAWIVRNDVDLAQACDAMLLLRGAFLDASGLDQASEPVPLLGGDRRTTVLTLAVYLDGLLQRGTRQFGGTRAELAEAALALLDQ
jgi:hypothetical protein